MAVPFVRIKLGIWKAKRLVQTRYLLPGSGQWAALHQTLVVLPHLVIIRVILNWPCIHSEFLFIRLSSRYWKFVIDSVHEMWLSGLDLICEALGLQRLFLLERARFPINFKRIQCYFVAIYIVFQGFILIILKTTMKHFVTLAMEANQVSIGTWFLKLRLLSVITCIFVIGLATECLRHPNLPTACILPK